MTYIKTKKYIKSIFTIASALLAVSCVDNGFEEFEAPTGNVNNIQPNTQFTNSVSADDNLKIIFRSYSTDAITYAWDFGDGGTSTEANPDYTYAVGGSYLAKLTTVSSDSLIAVDSAFVSPIFVDFTVGEPVDTEVSFQNLTHGAKSLSWDFGDGTVIGWESADTVDDADYNPTHVYKTADEFKVTLTATNFSDVQTIVTQNVKDLVLSTIPDFTFDVDGLSVEFTDASTLAVSHSWDFGDGNTSTDLNPTHTFSEERTYQITLTTTNASGVSKSITKSVPVGAVKATFKAIVQNGTADDFTKNTGDNADAWDMTPNSTVEANDGTTVDSPFRAIWNNTALNTYIDGAFGTNEQPGSSSDGSYVNGSKTRAVKLSNTSRRLYQVVEVEVGVPYTFTIDTRSEAAGINTEVFILNNEITTELDINTDPANNSNVDAYFDITNDFNSSKGSATVNTFTTTSFEFKPTTTKVVIYVRALNAKDSSNEVFIDNIDIITPGF